MPESLTVTKATRMRTVVLIGVVAALCFSVGEGLRLLPLPYTPSGPVKPGDSRAGASGYDAIMQSQLRPGSLGLPPRAQKDLRHKQTHYAPSSGCALPLPRHVLSRPCAQRRAGRALTASARVPAGRAPPRTA